MLSYCCAQPCGQLYIHVLGFFARSSLLVSARLLTWICCTSWPEISPTRPSWLMTSWTSTASSRQYRPRSARSCPSRPVSHRRCPWGNWLSPWLAQNDPYPGYFSLQVTALKPQQIPMFLNLSARVWGRRWSPHTSEQKGSVLKSQSFINQNACASQNAHTWKAESMLINFIHISLHDIFLMQSILYQI